MPASTLPRLNNVSQMRLAKSRIVEERVIPAGVANSAVARSWLRSAELGLSPRDKTFFRMLPAPGHARAIAERARRLVDAATPEIELVGSALTQPNMTVLCTDADGVIVHTCARTASASRQLREPLRIGRSLLEAEVGTTAPGCVLAERRPLVVNGEEHFLSEIGRFACAAAPVFQFDGSLAGVLDISGLDMFIDDLVADLVCVAARSSEHRLFATEAPGLHVRIHHDPRFLRTPLGGMLAIGDNGELIGACSGARKMLPLEGRSPFLSDVIDIDHELLRRRLHDDDVIELRRPGGGSLYAALATPKPRVAVAVAAKIHSSFGSDRAVVDAVHRASLAYARSIPVLLIGETGTGKSMLARALHDRHRTRGPFVTVACTAFPDTLDTCVGADGGTLFLDEIGDVDLPLQARLVQLLPSWSIVSATHRDLPAMVEAGQFREDLYHRINGLTVKLPPLRERTDFEELVDGFLQREASGRRLSTAARERLARHGWRGNVRELVQVIRTAVALSEGSTEIGVEHLPPQLACAADERAKDDATSTLLDRVTNAIARRVLAEHNGNVSAAARALGISRGTLYKKTRS